MALEQRESVLTLVLLGDRITAIGNLHDAKSAQKIDATNQIIAPGFVDVHNHTDGWILKHSHLTAKTLQGFTTEVLAADGISYAPVNEYTVRQWFFYLQALNALQQDEYSGWYSLHEFMSSMDGRNVQNAMTHIPYANIRSMYCGWGRGDVDDFQMQQIQDENPARHGRGCGGPVNRPRLYCAMLFDDG